MALKLTPYTAPDFSALGLDRAPDAQFARAPKDGVAPENYHAMSIFPEYFRVGGRWMLAEESRMDDILRSAAAICRKIEPNCIIRA